MNRSLLAGAAGLLSALTLGAAVAEAAPVTVRVEGASGSLAGPVTVDPASVGTLTRDSAGCAGTNSAAGALELATGGDWGGRNTSFGVGVTRIRTEDYPTSLSAGSQDAAYWSLIVNGVSTNFGPCEANSLNAGDTVVFAAACLNATTGCFTGGVLTATAPRNARPGTPISVAATQVVTTYDDDFNPTTTRTPADGATVAGGGGSATTGADGTASVTLTQRGPQVLRVTRAQQVPDTLPVCVTDGADGYCGTTAPDGTTLPPAIGGTAPATGGVAPTATLTGIKDKQRFTRKRAPRRLTADVADPSGLQRVKLSLTRKVGKRCWAFSGKSERFKRVRCGRHPVFQLEDAAADVDYLLPSRLGKGRYTLDVHAQDKLGNRSQLERGVSRAVFSVR